MRDGNGETVREPARDVPVYGTCDVLVVGGGPAGTAAAVAAGRLGADVVLVERYNHLGGLSTGGLVSWIDRMTDWEGNLVVAGVGARAHRPVRAGRDARTAAGDLGLEERRRSRLLARPHGGLARHGALVADRRSRVLKLVTNDIVRESNVHTLMHCWVVAADHARTTPSRA